MTLIELASLFEERKLWIVTASGLGKDALHIYFGMAVFLAVRLVWRGPRGALVAWLAVVAMACGGEWLDLTAEARHAAIQPDAAHWHDIWNTCFWPTVLLILSPWLSPGRAPGRLSRRARPPAAPTLSGEDAERRFEQA